MYPRNFTTVSFEEAYPLLGINDVYFSKNSPMAYTCYLVFYKTYIQSGLIEVHTGDEKLVTELFYGIYNAFSLDFFKVSDETRERMRLIFLRVYLDIPGKNIKSLSPFLRYLSVVDIKKLPIDAIIKMVSLLIQESVANNA